MDDLQKRKLWLIERLARMQNEKLISQVERLIREAEKEMQQSLSVLTPEQKAELRRRIEADEKGEAKSYTWEEVKQKALDKINELRTGS